MGRGKGGAVGGVRKEGGGRPGEALLGAEEVAVHFGVTKTTVYRWCKEGRVPCLKIGRFWRVRREALEYFPKKPEGG
jgi:excisionase family DNA binding protein